MDSIMLFGLFLLLLFGCYSFTQYQIAKKNKDELNEFNYLRRRRNW